MATEVRNTQGFTTPQRALFGFVAIATLLSSSPWEQSDQPAAMNTYGASLLWGALAAFGYKTGWPRILTWAIAISYLGLLISKLLGFAA